MGISDEGFVQVAGLVRAARAVADLSQRQLAERAALSKGAVSRMERDPTGSRTSVAAFVRAMDACGIEVRAGRDGRSLRADDDDARDRGGRRFPPHLDPHPVWGPRDWWGLRTALGLDRRIAGHLPVRSYDLCRNRRQRRRDRAGIPWDARWWHKLWHLVPPCLVQEVIACRAIYGVRDGRDTPLGPEGPRRSPPHRRDDRTFDWDAWLLAQGRRSRKRKVRRQV